MKRGALLAFGWGLGLGQLSAAAADGLQWLARHQMGPGGAEIMDYAPSDTVLLATFSRSKPARHGIEVIDLADPERPQVRLVIDLSGARFAEAAGRLDSVSSVAADPKGRGIGAASLIPEFSNLASGLVVVFNYRTGERLRAFDVGHHPDSVAFSHDGRFIITADEAEYKPHGAPQAPGSISVIELADSADPAAAVAGASVTTYPLDAPFLADGVDLSGLRRHHGNADTPLVNILEPEYISELGGEVFVSLQENNAIAVFDLSLRKWVRVFDMGTRLVMIDASDRDGPFGSAAAKIDDEVHGLPMPDTIKAFSWGDRSYIATANEGDARAHDEGDVIRLKHAGTGAPEMAPATRAALKARYGSDPLLDANLGRLQVSRFDGLDAAGRIERPTMFGTRGFSILDAQTGELVYDSGSFIETYALANDPATHNMNDGDAALRDARSDNKGPEIEAIAVADIDGELFVVVGNERQNGLFVFRANQPAQMQFFAYTNPHAEGDYSPESALIIPGTTRADGRHLLIVSFEGSGSILIYSLNP